MPPSDSQQVDAFLAKWQGFEGNERAHYQTFFGDLCVALGVEGPPPKGRVPGDPDCFDKDIKFFTSDKAESTRFADFEVQLSRPPWKVSLLPKNPSSSRSGQRNPKNKSLPSAICCSPHRATGLPNKSLPI